MFYLSDVDECLPDKISNEYLHLAHNCHADANCTNTKGSFYCTCLNGYSGNGVTCMGKLETFKANWTKRTPDPISDSININILYSVIVIKVVIKFYASTATAETVHVPVRTK